MSSAASRTLLRTRIATEPTTRTFTAFKSYSHWQSIVQPSRLSRAPKPRQAALDPRTLLLAAAISLGIAYGGFIFSSTNKSPKQQSTEEPSPIALRALEEGFTEMASAHLPPGRPGNLTADQEVKLKEMWSRTLEFFGMSHDEVHKAQANGTLHSPTSASETTPEKKKRGLMSRFSKKDKSESEGEGSAITNDKHGQVKEYEEALKSMSPEQIREAFWNMSKHDHPDAILLRFLRARKWDVQAAQIMSLSTLHWRLKDMHVDDEIMFNGEGHALKESQSSNAAEKKEGQDFVAQLRMGKSFLHGVDKDGRPCCYVRVRLHHGGEQSEKSLEHFTVYTIETARMLLRPPVDTATIVFDMTDFSMANMDYTPVKFMIKCFEANYPESLGSVIVYKAPWIFQGIWKIIKGWLDPVVASKVHFSSNVSELAEWIPKSQIMKELGGDEDWTYKYVEPEEGEDAQMSNTTEKEKLLAERRELCKSFESETVAWINGEDKGEGRGRLAQRLSENYWKLDPFIRARSLYDRTGIIGPMGKVDFYPKKDAPTKKGADDDLD
ncbi:Hypothetical predicted protein [Lecanosticta acicola]|uniref:CRAL-TRIO domain-containing protein n=1 Tax=Lecanosticta acicola TaxID=111012 RepID=A0AAI9EAV3_9PEZI|nr:Hypothetical predicted protein [Lecanosticta acicola]